MANNIFSNFFMADDEEFELLKEKKVKSGAVVGIVRGGIGVLCASGRVIDEDDNVLADDSNQFFWILDSVFGCMSGDVNNGRWIIQQVMKQVKILPCISIEEIARHFIHWANIKFTRVDHGKRSVEFVLIGRVRDEDNIRMYKIFDFQNDDPAMRRANASNPVSVKVRPGPPWGPFVAHAQAMCAIGGPGRRNDAFSMVRPISTGKQMRKVAVKVVIKSTKADRRTGGNINILTVSEKYEGPRFHSSFPVVDEEYPGRIKYGFIVEGGFMPQGYVSSG